MPSLRRLVALEGATAESDGVTAVVSGKPAESDLTYRFQGRDFRLTDVHGKVVRGILA